MNRTARRVQALWKFLASGVALVAAFGFASSAGATMIVITHPDNTGTDNVISGGSCAAHIDAGNPVEGCLNANHNQLIEFSTTLANGLHFASGGQAEIDGGPGPSLIFFGDLTIFTNPSQVPPISFDKVVLNIDATANGFVRFSDGLGDVSSPFAIGASGSNFFTIEVTPGNFSPFSLQTFSDAAGLNPANIVHDVKQVRLAVAVVPEPATLALLGVGLGVLAFSRRRRTG